MGDRKRGTDWDGLRRAADGPTRLDVEGPLAGLAATGPPADAPDPTRVEDRQRLRDARRVEAHLAGWSTT